MPADPAVAGLVREARRENKAVATRKKTMPAKRQAEMARLNEWTEWRREERELELRVFGPQFVLSCQVMHEFARKYGDDGHGHD